jgi:hypothetical protein
MKTNQNKPPTHANCEDALFRYRSSDAHKLGYVKKALEKKKKIKTHM